MKERFSYLFLAFALFCASFSVHAAGIISPTPSSDDIIAATNQAREAAGLAPLSLNPRLASAALDKIRDMESLGYFAHTGPDGLTPWDWIEKNGYNYLYAGENLAINYSDSQKLLDAWLASPEHKKNLLDPRYRDIGVGVESRNIDGHRYIFIVQMFGTPMELAYE